MSPTPVATLSANPSAPLSAKPTSVTPSSTKTRTGLSLAIAGVLAFALTLALAALNPGALGTAHAQTTLDRGHIDAFHVTAEGNSLRLDMKEDVTGQDKRRAPESVVLKVKQQAYTDKVKSVKGVGEAGYYLPITQDPNLIWPGWDTQALAGTNFSAVDIVFDQISGPGNVYLFSTSGFGDVQPLLANGATRLSSGAAIPQRSPAHTHANWVFTKPGTYTMRVHAQGKGANGANAKSNTATYTWSVGDASATSGRTPASTAGSKNASSKSGAGNTTGKAAESTAPGASGGAAGNQGGTGADGQPGGPAGDPAGEAALAADGGTGTSDTAATGELANTGPSTTTIALTVLGIGLVAFGLGWVALNKGSQRVVAARRQK